MTRHLRTARACQAAVVGLTTCGLYGASIHPVLALPGLIGAAVFACCSVSYLAQHHNTLARHETARRAALAPQPAIPPACCPMWTESAGAFHGEECTRPVDARADDYRLDPAAAAEFAEINAHYDDRSAA